MITISTFTTATEAHIVKGRLEAEGIRTSIADEHLITVDWTMSLALGGVRLQVPAESVAQAQKIISELDSGSFEEFGFSQLLGTSIYDLTDGNGIFGDFYDTNITSELLGAGITDGINGTALDGLTNVTLPYVIKLANEGWEKACKNNVSLAKGLNIVKGEIVYKEIAEAFDLEFAESY